MKKINHYLWGLILSLALMQGSLFAEMVRGQVTAINKQNQSITILEQDASGATQGSKELTLRPNAQFAGIQSLDDLEVGDEVQAEFDKKIFGKGEVKQLTSTKPKGVKAVIRRLGGTRPQPAAPKKVSQSEASLEAETARSLSSAAKSAKQTAGELSSAAKSAKQEADLDMRQERQQAY